MQYPVVPKPVGLPRVVHDPAPAGPPVRHYEVSSTFPDDADLEAHQRAHAKAMAPTLAALRTPQRARLQPDGEVMLINSYPHGFVYVTSRHTSRGLPLPGKVYSLWYDRTRRPYRYGGGLQKDDGGPPDMATRWQERFAARGADAQERADLRDSVASTTAYLRAALRELRGQRYPHAGLFLHALHDKILKQFNSEAPQPLTPEETREATTAICENILEDCYADLMRCNDLHAGDEREMWPIVSLSDRQITRDTELGLAYENMRRWGDPYATQLLQHVPWFPHAMYMRPSALSRTLARNLRGKVQPVSHTAVREAYRSMLVGMMYMDERLQRPEAVGLESVVDKPQDWRLGYAAYNNAMRAEAVKALSKPVQVRDPVLQETLNASRAARAQAMQRAEAFPVLANVPWRVNSHEVQDLRIRRFVAFRPIPRPGRTPAEGNCNSGAFALLHMAAAVQQAMDGAPQPPTLAGGTGKRTFGAKVNIDLPHLRALPRTPQSA